MKGSFESFQQTQSLTRNHVVKSDWCMVIDIEHVIEIREKYKLHISEIEIINAIQLLIKWPIFFTFLGFRASFVELFEDETRVWCT